MGKIDDNDLDFVKLYFSATIVLYAILFIIGLLAVFIGDRQSLFSDTYKTFIVDIILVTQFLGIVYVIMSIFALIKFVRKKLGILYILVPSITIGSKLLPNNVWVVMIMIVIIIILSSYILYKLKKLHDNY